MNNIEKFIVELVHGELKELSSLKFFNKEGHEIQLKELSDEVINSYNPKAWVNEYIFDDIGLMYGYIKADGKIYWIYEYDSNWYSTEIKTQ